MGSGGTMRGNPRPVEPLSRFGEFMVEPPNDYAFNNCSYLCNIRTIIEPFQFYHHNPGVRPFVFSYLCLCPWFRSAMDGRKYSAFCSQLAARKNALQKIRFVHVAISVWSWHTWSKLPRFSIIRYYFHLTDRISRWIFLSHRESRRKGPASGSAVE